METKPDSNSHHSLYIFLFLLMIVIIAVSASLLILKKQKIKQATAEQASISMALSYFIQDCGRLPTKKEGIKALLINPKIRGWNGPYVGIGKNTKFADPWGTTYQFRVIKGKIQVQSAGPDKKFGT